MATEDDSRPSEEKVIPLVTKKELEAHAAAAAAGVRVLTLSDFNQLLLQLENIRGMVELIHSHVDLEKNIGAMAALAVIREKAVIAADILESAPRVA